MKRSGIWIWENPQARYDEFADFSDGFTLQSTDTPVMLRISADTNYAVYVNGTLAAFGQYADFPHCKVVNTHELTAFCKSEENTLQITVWYHGAPSSTYQTGQAGLFFEVTANGAILACSGEHTACRKSAHYVPYRKKLITKEQGFSVFYNSAADETPYHPALATGYAPVLHPRPVSTLTLEPLCPGSVIGGNGSTRFLLDLGREEVGFLSLALHSETAQTVVIAYGEHLVDGAVPRFIEERDFSVEFGAKVGENSHLEPFRRLGCRYLEVLSEHPITLHQAGIRPTMYPVTVLPFDAGSPRRQRIYDTAVRTLRLCMHEHYEDCPWREQSLYALDSRNQMLCGYYAFGEIPFARASLWLFGQDRREDGLLSDCVPSGIGLAIPSFCLHWYQAVLEYTEFSGDLSLAQEIWEKLCSVLEAFLRYFDRETGLLRRLPSEEYWNFYEWSGRYLMGDVQAEGADLILNCLFLRAIDNMTRLSALTGLPFELSPMAAPLRQAIRQRFRRPDGLFQTTTDGSHICKLGCALAVLTGAATGDDARAICQMLVNEAPHVKKIPIDHARLAAVSDKNDESDGFTHAVSVSLSMTAFVYDALLQTDKDAYADYVLQDIDSRYGFMLDAGATTFWETMGGWHAFEEAGSLCHGWSCLSVYYYHKLLGKNAQ